MNLQQRRAQLRAQLASDHCVYPASVFDPVSARIAEQLGYEVGMFAGSIASITVLGDPDHIVLTLSEFAQQAHRICRASELPVLVDADHGYGNALNVKRTIEELETAGVAGLSIEDTLLPRPYGSGGETQLVSIAEGVGKMRAALEGRQDPGLVIAARTSAVSITGLDNTIERIKAYQETGVDAIFLIGIKQKSQLEKISKCCSLPIILGGAGPEILKLDFLNAMGVRLCLGGHAPAMAAIQAVYSSLKAMSEGVAPSEIQGVPDREFVETYTRSESYHRWIREFMEPS